MNRMDDWVAVIRATRTNVLRTDDQARQVRQAGRAAAKRLRYQCAEDAVEARNRAAASRINRERGT